VRLLSSVVDDRVAPLPPSKTRPLKFFFDDGGKAHAIGWVDGTSAICACLTRRIRTGASAVRDERPSFMKRALRTSRGVCFMPAQAGIVDFPDGLPVARPHRRTLLFATRRRDQFAVRSHALR